MTTIKKGDTSAEMSLVLAEGFDYAGKTVFVEYQGARRAFSGVVAGGSVAFSFTARETAAMSLGVYPVFVRIEGGGEPITVHNAAVKIRVTDCVEDVRSGSTIYVDVRGGLFGIEGLPARYTDEDLKAKVNEIVRRLGGTVAALLVCALPAFGAGVTVLTAPKGAIYNDQPVVTNIIADIPEVDMSAVTNIAQEAATAAQERAVADAADYTDRATNALSAALTAAIPTDNAQLANGAGYVTAAITNGLQLTETDPNVPEWAKAESAPLPPNYATVSNRAMSALQSYTETDPKFSEWKNENWIEGLQAVTWASDAYYAMHLGNGFEVNYTAYDITTATNDLWQANAGQDTVLGRLGEWCDDLDGRLDSAEGSIEHIFDTDLPELREAIPTTAAEVHAYPDASGNQLAQQVAAIGAHLNGEDARFVVTNYDSVVHTPEAYVEIKVSNNWLRVWDEGTRWNQYEVWKTNVDAELSYKADRAWGIYDSETGGYSPAGFTQVSSSNILIASGMAYQRTITSDGAVWVLQCNQGVAQVSGDTNGFFRVMDSDGVTQFEIIKGDRREMGCDASGISLDHSTTPNNVIIPYSVVSEEHPTLYITERLETPNWKAETDSDCIATVTWTGSSGAYVATVHPKQNYASMFIRATYEVGGETYIRNNAPVGMDSIILNGVKYYLGTATISGHTVLTLSTTAP